MALSVADFLTQARERWKLADESESAQAQREREDIAFEDGDQWPTDVLDVRKAQGASQGLPAVPARPSIVINQISEPIRQVLNQERASDIGIEIVPADDFGDLGVLPDDTEVELREGLVRRIQRESIAADARTWAFKRAVIAGRGYYLVMTRFLPGKTWDQEIFTQRIYRQEAVLIDPSHEQPDGSDAGWEFIGTWETLDKYQAKHPRTADGKKNSQATWTDTEFMAMTEQYPDWYRATETGKTKDGDTILQYAVRKVHYWYQESESVEYAVMADGRVLEASEVPVGEKPIDTRTDVRTSIKYCLIGGGTQILEQTDWAGPDMPIIKVLGDEVLPYDHERRARGMVRPARGSNLGTNYLVSKFVETVGLSPIPRDTIDPDAISGYEKWWEVAHLRTLPYRPYRSHDDQGNEFRQPVSNDGDPNILPIAQGIAMFREFVQTTTSGAAANRLGTNQRIQANKAIERLQEEEAFNTSNFLDNLARSVRYEAQVINNLLYPIYGARPGRLVRLLTGESDMQMWQIGQGPNGQPTSSRAQKVQQIAKLTKDAHFNVAVKITKNSDLRNDQEAQSLGEMIAAEPTLMTWFGDLYFRARNIPNRKALADRARVMLHPQIQAMLKNKEQGQKFDPAAQAEIAQLSQRLQELTQIAGRMDQEIKTQQAEQQAKVAIEQGKAQSQQQIEQLKAQAQMQIADLEAKRDLLLAQQTAATDLERARMDNATKIHVVEIAAKTKGVIKAQEMEHEAIALAHATQHEAEQVDLDRDNLERQADRQEAEAERDRQFNAGENEANRQAKDKAGA